MNEAKCVICGKEFEKITNQKTCSTTCSEVQRIATKKAYRERTREEHKAWCLAAYYANAEVYKERAKESARKNVEATRERHRRYREKKRAEADQAIPETEQESL